MYSLADHQADEEWKDSVIHVAGEFHAAMADSLEASEELPFSALVSKLREVGVSSNSGASVGRRGPGGRGRSSPEERFASRDMDENGLLEGDEISGFLSGNTSYADDGSVTKAEFLKAWEELASRRGGAQRGGGGSGRRGGGLGTSSGSAPTDAKFLAMLDSNKDGKVNLSEVEEAIFAEVHQVASTRLSLDSDGDGSLTPDEYKLSRPNSGEGDGEISGHTMAHFRMEDLDGDGAISTTEMTTRAMRSPLERVKSMIVALRLSGLDEDADQAISASELRKAVDKDWIREEERATVLGGDAQVQLSGLLEAARRLRPSEEDHHH
ncbi:MAG: hypothetical protein AAGB46_18535 [Verrucomicrobiota bacterium]